MTLVSLLKHVGIDAYTVMASTEDFGEVDTAYANTVQFNTVLAGVPYENHLILMDATDRHTPFRQIPDGRYDRIMWALSPDKMFFVEIDNTPDGGPVAKKMSE